MHDRRPTDRWQAALEEALVRGLPGFLPSQRWFGAKARRIVAAGVRDVFWLADDEDPCALVLVGVEYANDPPYAMLIAMPRETAGGASLGTIAAGGRTRQLVEASTSARDVLALARHLGRAHDVLGARGGRLRIDDVSPTAAGGLDPEALDEGQVRPLGAEQSNTSIRFGTRHVFKLLRRLESGENPEVEIGRFLAGHSTFRAVPALRGSITWVPADDAPATVGVVQDLVPNLGDGWQWALARLGAVLARAEPLEPLVEHMITLGTTTAEMHGALASGSGVPGFDPEPVTAADARAWQESLRVRADRTLALVAERLADAPPAARAACTQLLRLTDRLASAAGLPAPVNGGAFEKIRVHGDYHLGQTLKTPAGFVIIDFEGEPARPLAERRRVQCALKDVAGMLRSFSYAVETARAQVPGDEATASSVHNLRDGFLRGYLDRSRALASRHLPADADACRRWIEFFEVDKALYEIEYEIQNRPTWLHIPASGLVRLLAGGAG
jgi:maltose alpha-D-glucosyltransferase/alpha-amylase